MIQKIYEGKAQAILCWKLDRLARNPVDGGTINWMLQSNVIRQIKTNDREYNPNDNVLMMSVEFGMANQFIRDLSANTKRGLRAKAEKGIFPKMPPIGYLSDKYKPKGEKGVLVDPDKFHIVRKLWDILLERKLTLTAIHTIAVDELGLKGHKGRPIALSTIYKIFNSPFYYGDFQWGGKIYHGTHEKMITKEEFDIAQAIISKRGKIHAIKHHFPFTGLLRCGECGSMITAEEKTKKQKNGNVHHYTYYRCTKRKGIKCSQPCIRNEELLKQIGAVVSGISIPKEFRNWALEILRAEHAKESSNGELVVKQRQVEYEACLRKLNNLTDLRISGDIDQETYNQKKIMLMNEKERAQRLIQDADKQVTTWLDHAEQKLLFAERAKELFSSGEIETQRNVLEALGTNFLLKDKVLTFDIEKVFESVRTAAKSVSQLHARLEPVKNGFTSTQYAEMYDTNTFLGD